MNIFPRKSKGIALILCLVLMAVFFAISTYVTGKQKQQLQLFMGLQQKVEFQYQAESLIQQLNYSVVTNTPFVNRQREFILNDRGEYIKLSDEVELKIRNGYGMLSMIPFDDEAFALLVDKITEEPGKGQTLVAKILDWQDLDDLERLNGKESSFLSDDGYHHRNYILQSLSELKLIDGVTDSLFNQLEPYLIYYKIAEFDREAAGSELRLLLDMAVAENPNSSANLQVNGLQVGIQQPLIIDIKIKGEFASLHQKYFIRYWPTTNELWGYSEYGE